MSRIEDLDNAALLRARIDDLEAQMASLMEKVRILDARTPDLPRQECQMCKQLVRVENGRYATHLWTSVLGNGPCPNSRGQVSLNG